MNMATPTVEVISPVWVALPAMENRVHPTAVPLTPQTAVAAEPAMDPTGIRALDQASIETGGRELVIVRD